MREVVCEAGISFGGNTEGYESGQRLFRSGLARPREHSLRILEDRSPLIKRSPREWTVDLFESERDSFTKAQSSRGMRYARPERSSHDDLSSPFHAQNRLVSVPGTIHPSVHIIFFSHREREKRLPLRPL